MTQPTQTASLHALLDRVAITELIHAVAHAMDTRDWPQLASCYDEASMGDYPTAQVWGREAIIAGAKGFLEPLGATQHLVGNLRITLEADTATTHATFIAQHVSADAPGQQFILGGNYEDTLRRTQDGWKITKRRIRGLWSHGDPAVLATPVS